jgi:hypothetical protein
MSSTDIIAKLPVVPFATQTSRPWMQATISTGSHLIGAGEKFNLREAVQRLEVVAAELPEIERKLRDRAQEFANPVRVVGESLRINEDGMIPEVPYHVTWNGEQYEVIKALDGKLKLAELLA